MTVPLNQAADLVERGSLAGGVVEKQRESHQQAPQPHNPSISDPRRSRRFVCTTRDMRILVSNDDGVYSPGIRALAEVAAEFGQVRIVAPDVERSSTGHAITAAHPLS